LVVYDDPVWNKGQKPVGTCDAFRPELKYYCKAAEAGQDIFKKVNVQTLSSILKKFKIDAKGKKKKTCLGE